MNIRFYNARILTMEEGAGVTEGELWVKGNRIAPAGPPDGTVWDREIDARGNLLLPGFKNAHTHSGMTFLRSYADDQPLHDWLQECFPMEAKLRPGDVYDLTRLAIMEYLTSGVTANFDMYMFPDEIAKAAADCGFRTVLCGCVNNFTYNLPFMEKCWDEYNRYDELVSFILGFHAEYTCSRELLEGMAALAHKYEAPVFTHNSETRLEVDGCLERWGMTPTAFLDSLGMFDYGGGGYHGVYLNDADLEIFRRRGLWMVTNPGSNVKLASGIAPLQKMLDAGVNLALGTDGPASNNCLDFFREMFLATGLQKLREDDASAMPADRVLEMATVGGARAMGLSDCDTLAPGKCADLVMLDLHQPNMQPLNNIAKNVVYSGSKQNVKLTMVNGRILYEDGQFHIGADPEEVYRRCNEIIDAKR